MLSMIANTKEVAQQSLTYHCSRADYSSVCHLLLVTNSEILNVISKLETYSQRFHDLAKEQERLSSVVVERSKDKV